MNEATLRELADTWDVMAATEDGTTRREALRECADALRMLLDVKPAACPHAAPFVYCQECVVSPCPVGLGRPVGGCEV